MSLKASLIADPSLHGKFTFVTAPVQSNEHDAWTVKASGGKVTITSTSTPGLGRALLEYLRHLGGDIYWSGDTFSDLSYADADLSGSSWAEHRHLFNLVTHSYSLAFYDWAKWEYLLDWAVLHGYNLPLAYTGQEYVYAQVWKDLGVPDEAVLKWVTGPAFHGWSRHGNIHGNWHGTTTWAWLEGQHQLQKQILQRQREFGMTPVLPGFCGFVPPELHDYIGGPDFKTYPTWMSFPDEYTHIRAIDPEWDTWNTVQSAFLRKQAELYGFTSDFYMVDLFTESKPTSTDPTYLKGIATAVRESIHAVAPKATWVMQGWIFVNDPKSWTETASKAFLDGAGESLLVLDLAAESYPQWKRLKSFFGRRWLWCTLINYGQNNGLYGALDKWNHDIMDAKANGGRMSGMGIVPEGINNNEHLFELATDQGWRNTPIDLKQWTQDWVKRRYRGKNFAFAQKAWELLDNSVYKSNNTALKCTTRSLIDLRPAVSGLLNTTGNYLATAITYEPRDVVAALDNLLKSASIKPGAGGQQFDYDLVDVARQVFVNAAIPIYKSMLAAWNGGNKPDVEKYGRELVSLINDIDRLMATSSHFRLENWVNDARNWASDTGAKDDMEFQARNQLVLWGPATFAPWPLDRYAAKHWHGVMSEVYAKGWELLYQNLLKTEPKAWNKAAFAGELMEKVEKPWENVKSGGVQGPQGDSVAVIQELREKYKQWLV